MSKEDFPRKIIRILRFMFLKDAKVHIKNKLHGLIFKILKKLIFPELNQLCMTILRYQL